MAGIVEARSCSKDESVEYGMVDVLIAVAGPKYFLRKAMMESVWSRLMPKLLWVIRMLR